MHQGRPDSANPCARADAALAEWLLQALPEPPPPPTDRLVAAANAALRRRRSAQRLSASVSTALLTAALTLLQGGPIPDSPFRVPGAQLAAPPSGPTPDRADLPAPKRAPPAIAAVPRAMASSDAQRGEAAPPLPTPPLRHRVGAVPLADAPALSTVRRLYSFDPELWLAAGAQVSLRRGAAAREGAVLEGGVRLGEHLKLGLRLDASAAQPILLDEPLPLGAELSPSLGVWVKPREPLTAGLLVGLSARWQSANVGTTSDDLYPTLSAALGADLELGQRHALHPSVGVQQDLRGTVVEWTDSAGVQQSQTNLPRTSLRLSLTISRTALKKPDQFRPDDASVVGRPDSQTVKQTE